MKTKHTFVLTLFLGICWAAVLFANQLGPVDPVSGVFNTNCTLCHSSFPANSGTGSITVSGLPDQWTPGQAYPITVTVAGGNVYGFQFSAVRNAGSPQSTGTLTPANNRVKVVTLTGLQFAEHT